MKKQFFGVLLIAASLCVACDTDTDPEQDNNNNNAEQPATPEQPATAEVGSSQQYLRAATIFNNAFDESGAALRQNDCESHRTIRRRRHENRCRFRWLVCR